jgi:hypothetical protein
MPASFDLPQLSKERAREMVPFLLIAKLSGPALSISMKSFQEQVNVRIAVE